MEVLATAVPLVILDGGVQIAKTSASPTTVGVMAGVILARETAVPLVMLDGAAQTVSKSVKTVDKK